SGGTDGKLCDAGQSVVSSGCEERAGKAGSKYSAAVLGYSGGVPDWNRENVCTEKHFKVCCRGSESGSGLLWGESVVSSLYGSLYAGMPSAGPSSDRAVQGKEQDVSDALWKMVLL